MHGLSKAVRSFEGTSTSTAVHQVVFALHSRHFISNSSRHVRAEAETKVPRSYLGGIGSNPWPELDLQEIYGRVPAVRIRQHVNPLRQKLQTPTQPLDWKSVFADSSRPLVLDIGCAGGRFVLALAKRMEGHNFLGLDIRKTLLERANEWAKALALDGQVRFEYANATISLETMLATYPGPLLLATIQFPDPHFKNRHKKRRIVQPQLIRALAKLMPAGGHVFLQSDVMEVTAAMRDEFEQFGSKHFTLATQHRLAATSGQNLEVGWQTEDCQEARTQLERALQSSIERITTAGAIESQQAGGNTREAESADEGVHSGEVIEQTVPVEIDEFQPTWCRAGWLADNPLGVPTEREVNTLQYGGGVYRVLLLRK